MARRQLPATKVKQWLTAWDDIIFDEDAKRPKPDPFFFFFSIKAEELRKLSNVYRRIANQPRVTDPGVQRDHKEERSEEIAHFIQGGYPWSVISNRQRENPDNDKLKMPGWLPTSIIANILAPGTMIGKKTLTEKDAVKITEDNGRFSISLPENFESEDWKPDVFPISIIDGQHRLLAFDYLAKLDGDFELPVIAFDNIGRTWQAYLFYTINIKPKKIKTSLAYDLFPILRTQEWLEKSPDGLMVYRETRAQELTEILWYVESSPWHKRINMLDQPGEGDVTQAAFIRTILASMVKSADSGERSVGGLFGSQINANEIVNWDRLQQGAFLIYVWQLMEEHVKAVQEPWATELRRTAAQAPKDPAFFGKTSLLTTDQGVRVFFNVINDMVFEFGHDNDLNEIYSDVDLAKKEEILEDQKIDVDYILQNIEQFKKHVQTSEFLTTLIKRMSEFDWRTSAATGLNEQEKLVKLTFRGSSGYRELRKQVINFIIDGTNGEVKSIAESIKQKLGF